MTPDDLDSRLRRTMDEVSSAWQPKACPAKELVGDVSRRRVKRHRSVATIGCAVAAAIAVVAGTGVFSTTARTDNRVASGAGVRGPAPSVGSGSTASSGLASSAGAPSGTSTASECASVTVGSGVSRCAGVFFASAAGIQGFATSNSAAGTSSTTPSPASVTVKVGQRVTVSLPATTTGSWGAPVVVSASNLSTTLRQELPVSVSRAHPGVMRAVGQAQNGARQSDTSVFEAMRPGDVMVTATLARACARASNLQAPIVSPPCAEISNQWLMVVVVSR
jgi:hypothetical protein